jgi:hypothetical protein
MKNIFIGFLLVFLDFDLKFGNSKIGLIPDFIGYFVMISGLVEMAGESPLFMKVKPYVTGMAFYTGVLYVLNLAGISMSLGVLSYGLAFIPTVVSLYISYNIVMAVIDMEGKYNTSFNGGSLKPIWTLLAVFNILSFVSLLFSAAAIIFIIVSFIVAVYFLFAFNKSKNLYYDAVG